MFTEKKIKTKTRALKMGRPRNRAVNDKNEVLIGKVLGSNGVKGWVRIYSYTRPFQGILAYSPWTLIKGETRKTVELASSRTTENKIFALLEGCSDRDQADMLKDCQIFVDRSLLPDLEDGEIYWKDLEGMLVKNLDGFLLGTVKSLIETGANDVLVVQGGKDIGDRKERLIPYVENEVVIRIDEVRKELIVDWEPEY